LGCRIVVTPQFRLDSSSNHAGSAIRNVT
jgi:hypothetical protein